MNHFRAQELSLYWKKLSLLFEQTQKSRNEHNAHEIT